MRESICRGEGAVTGRQPANTDPLDRVFRRVELLTTVGAALSTLEWLAAHRQLADTGFFAWPEPGRSDVHRSRPSSGSAAITSRLLSYPNVLGVIGVRAAAAIGLLLPGTGRAWRGVSAGAMIGTETTLNARVRYGGDGSDQFSSVSFLVCTLEKLFGGNPAARELLVRFLAGQACFSYFTSGVAKLISPVWRDGSAAPMIFRTRTYGHPSLFRLVNDRPLLAKAMTWATIVGEMSFPLVLVAPKPVARGILATGVAFHLANARYMGLNRFLWAFTGMYPAVAYASRSLGRPRSAGAVARPVKHLLRPLWGAARATPARAVAGAAAALVVGAAAVAGVSARRRASLTAAMPGTLLDIRGRRVHMLAKATGTGPTVVFENGLGVPLTGWSWVLQHLADDVPLLCYDRPGIGWSQSRPRPLDAHTAAAHLRAVLATAGVSGPVVLVGHSTGGLLIRGFAARYPEQVAGLVFVDSSHPEQLDRSATQRSNVPVLKQVLSNMQLKAATGTLDAATISRYQTLPDDLGERSAVAMRRVGMWRAARQEMTQCERSWMPDLRGKQDLSPYPIAVVTAGQSLAGDPDHGTLQKELAMLSPTSSHRVVEGANHEGLLFDENPAAAVAESIQWVRAQSRLRPC